MGMVRWLLSFALLASLLALAAPASSPAFSTPTWVPRADEPAKVILLVEKEKHKKVRSCNKGDNRKGQTNAAVDAWAVACEFPPRSEPNWVASAQGATTAAIVAGGA